MFHWANPGKNKTRRTKKGARIEIASFQNGARIGKYCAQEKARE